MDERLRWMQNKIMNVVDFEGQHMGERKRGRPTENNHFTANWNETGPYKQGLRRNVERNVDLVCQRRI